MLLMHVVMSQFGGAVPLCSIYKSKHSHRYRLYSIGISSQLSTYLRSFSVVEIPWQRTNGFFHQKTAPLLRSAHRWNSSVEKVERISSWQSKFQVFSAAKPTFESTAKRCERHSGGYLDGGHCSGFPFPYGVSVVMGMGDSD